MIDKLAKFVQEEKRWIEAGSPVRTKDESSFLHNICKECPFFNKGGGWLPGHDSCNKCGCNIHPTSSIFNKLHMATTSCPDTPPRWTEDLNEKDG